MTDSRLPIGDSESRLGRDRRVGVVLFQLGGPDSLEAVRPFLYNLFCDPDIIDLPLGGVIRRPLAWWIARRRSAKVAAHYAEIGGRSPIRLLTERQARALERALEPHADARVVIAMRYWHPFTAEAVAELQSAGIEDVVLLPLYPQYSFATTASSLNEWARVCRRRGARFRARTLEHFYTHPLYLRAMAEKIRISLAHFDHPGAVHLLFSAHSLPVSFIERGDPYQRQVEETVRLVMSYGGWPNPHALCYQSKVGRQAWLEPSLDSTIERLAAAGHKSLLVVPVSFVTEHIETLHEINIEARAEGLSLGIEQFEMVPAVGDTPEFIAALADMVLGALRGTRAAAGQLQVAASRPQ